MRQKKARQFTILLIGVTGAGKSTFAAHASGADVVIGDDLDPCTQDPLAVPFMLDGYQIVLIDTPGFDDDKRGDVEILHDVSKWMISEGMLSKNQPVDALILLHPVTRDMDGITGEERRRTRLLEKLLGDDSYKRVTIATTMWGSLDPIYAAELERDLTKSHRLGEGGVWHDFCKRGASVERHDNSRDSAHGIIRRIIDRSNAAEKPPGMQRSKDTANRNVISLGPSFFKQLVHDLEEDIEALRKDILLHREDEPELPVGQAADPAEQLRWKVWEKDKMELEERVARREAHLRKLRTAVVSTC